MMKKVLLMLAVLSISIAYYMYEPIPPDWEEPWKTRLMLSAYRLLGDLTYGLSFVGIEPINLTRVAMDTLAPYTRTEGKLRKQVIAKDMEIEGIRVRLYEPRAMSVKKKKESKKKNKEDVDENSLVPGMVYYHGGGWTYGSIETHDLLVRRLVYDLDVVAISVGYRKAPEYKYPAALDDSIAVAKYFLTYAKDFGVHKDRIILAGDSAGGNLVAAIGIKLRDERFAPRPRLLLLFYPALQALDLKTPSYQANKHGPLLTSQAVGFYWSNYITGSPEYAAAFQDNQHVPQYVLEYMRNKFLKTHELPFDDIRKAYNVSESPEKSELFEKYKDVLMSPYVSPLFADDLRKLPPTYINVCQYDVLRDDGLWYIERLRKAGVQVKLDYSHCFHAWNMYTQDLASANKAMRNLVDYVKPRL